MSPTEILFAAGIIGGSIAIIYFLAAKDPSGSWKLAAVLCAAFAAYSGVTIAAEGPTGFIANHTANLWGVQVWYDLIFSVGIALFLIVPRARAAGMATAPWILLTGLTASIGLLAMIARLLWLEQRKSKAV